MSPQDYTLTVSECLVTPQTRLGLTAVIQPVLKSQTISARRLYDSVRTRIPAVLRRNVLLAIRRARATRTRAYPAPILGLAGDGQAIIPRRGDRPRALLSYLVEPVAIPEGDERFLRHANVAHAREMVRALNRMGYVVDAVDYRDTSFIPKGHYDLFVGHGGLNFERISRRLSKATVRVYFSTGCYWKFHNDQELARLAGLSSRRGLKVAPDRLILNSEEGALRAAHAIVALGNRFTSATYAAFPRVIPLDGAVPHDDWYGTVEKDFAEGRNHFLYYAGDGCVHKGLDLLLESFAALPQQLWICARMDPGFSDAYARELADCPNIHLVGWVLARSARFYGLMSRCNWVILASCSEGQAQSVVECMNHGLVPVVSRATGLDTDGVGFLLDPCTIGEVSRTVAELADLPPEHCREMSRAARMAAVTDYSLERFSRRFEDAMASIVLERDAGGAKATSALRKGDGIT